MDGWHSWVLTALQLQSADLSVHGVLGQVHVAGNRSRDAAAYSLQEHCKPWLGLDRLLKK